MIEELGRRGYPRPVVFPLRVVAGLGLWWNLIAWEWAHLDLYDVLLGYGINFFLAAIVLGIATVYTLIGGGSTSLFATLTLASSVISISLFILVKRGYAKSRDNLGEERAA
jgi:hypothetical protein